MRAFLRFAVLACSSVCACASVGTSPPRQPAPAEVTALELRAQRDTGRVEVQLDLVAAYRGSGRLREALPLAQRTLARWPENAQAALLVGLTQEDLGDLPAARQAYERALRTTRAARVRTELRQRLVLLQRRETQAFVQQALARESELASTAPRPRTVAVFPLAVPGPDSVLRPLGRALTAMLITDLARTDRLTVLDRSVVQMLADEIQLAELGYVDLGTAARGGRLLGAERIVQGSLTSAEERLRLEAAVVRVAPAGAAAEAPQKAAPAPKAAPGNKAPPARADRRRPAPAVKPPARGAKPAEAPAAEKARALPVAQPARLAESDRLDALFDMEKRLALGIYSAAGIELTPAERADITAKRTENLQAVLAYGRGLLAADAGDLGAALRYFSESARLDPGFTPARTQAAAARALVAASAVSTAQLAATAEQAAATAQAAVTAATNLLPIGRDALAELLGREGTTASTAIELVLRRPGGAQ